MKKHFYIILSLFFIFLSCNKNKAITYDLIIINANIINTKTGKILENKTLLIHNGIIENVLDNEAYNIKKSYKSKKTINANGKLVTAGFIDTHIHPTDVFGDYANAPKFLPKDSVAFLRQKLSNEYLPYGTTTVMTMGQPENWVKPLLEWQKIGNQNDTTNVDFYVCGGALISKDNRTPYIGHTEVITPAKAQAKVLEYNSLGIKHIKLYFRLKEPEFSVICKVADSLKMKKYGHIGDFNPEYLTMQHALKAGITNYEHLATIPNSLITSDKDWEILNKQFADNFGEINTEARMLEFFLEQFRFLSEQKEKEMQFFIENLVLKKATFSTTIHRIYEQIAPTFYTQAKDTTLTPKQLKRSQENFAILMKYTKQMHQKGIKIRLGSDMANGGKANISELIILAKYGFSVADIFEISSYNGAKALGIENEVGTIEKGKKANLIIWDKNPFDNYENFSSKMTIIKSGSVVSGA